MGHRQSGSGSSRRHRAKSLAKETGIHHSYHRVVASRRPKIDGASRGFKLAKGRRGEIKLNVPEIQWTRRKITLIALLLGVPYLFTIAAVAYAGAVGAAMVLTGILAACALMVGLLLWFANASL